MFSNKNKVHFLLEQFHKNTTLIFVQNLRTISVSAKVQNLIFSIKAVNKTAASAAQFMRCILLHAYSCTTAVSSCASPNKKMALA